MWAYRASASMLGASCMYISSIWCPALVLPGCLHPCIRRVREISLSYELVFSWRGSILIFHFVALGCCLPCLSEWFLTSVSCFISCVIRVTSIPPLMGVQCVSYATKFGWLAEDGWIKIHQPDSKCFPWKTYPWIIWQWKRVKPSVCARVLDLDIFGVLCSFRFRSSVGLAWFWLFEFLGYIYINFCIYI